ncbi:hypothetical protein [Devosia sp. Naph2]|uniref:hypothetical protein n=1 Tax=Devosia polycyclovorans TaxID=3345148 RepID=UPI0035CF0769
MIQIAIDKWSAWPTWAKWASGIGTVVLIEAVMVASGERNFFAGLVEHSVAVVLRYGMIALAFGGAYWVGTRIAKRSSNWLGWVAGIVFCLAVIWFGMDIITSLPGVGWRVTAMMNSDCYTDWDGRSNPSVC